MADTLVLRLGAGRWLARAQVLAVPMALAGLLAAPTETLPTGAALVMLAGAAWFSLSRSWAPATPGRLLLAQDGEAVVFTDHGRCQARLRPGAWVSGVLCVLTLQDRDSGRRVRCLVCRSLNEPSAWRGLLRRLRYAAGEAPGAGPAPS